MGAAHRNIVHDGDRFRLREALAGYSRRFSSEMIVPRVRNTFFTEELILFSTSYTGPTLRSIQVRPCDHCLRYVIVDELHAFIGVERGMQLQSLLHRIELSTRRQVPRVGLSATLGDMALAQAYLRPSAAANVKTIIDSDEVGELKLQIRGYQSRPPQLTPQQAEAVENTGREVEIEEILDGDVLDISRDLFRALRGSSNLIFANARRHVEQYADLLRRACERHHVPCEFFPHHGSLSKELREYVEADLKGATRPINAICTSTLEMGIDIGSVTSIAQVGPPHQVASMRQRLGRSGRRGEASILRLYISEKPVTDVTALMDRLRPALFQSTAMTKLLLAKWTEPPRAGALHLSTLIQQILSVIAQYGGATVKTLWNTLCENAPFAAVGRNTFLDLLRQMGVAKLLTQSADGTLLHGEIGEQVVNHYSFYAAFNTPEEFTLAADGRILGTLPITQPVSEGSFMIFSGRRWRVLTIDDRAKRIDLARAGGGRVPQFGGTPGIVHDVIRATMYDLYVGSEIPVYLNTEARRLFEEGRFHFHELNLDTTAFVESGSAILTFPWVGDITAQTLAVMLSHQALQTESFGLCLTTADTSADLVCAALNQIQSNSEANAKSLAKHVKNKASEKYDTFLSDDLLSLDWASRRLDCRSALNVARMLINR